eukprot:CAMPEP_0183805300 /NCGR_PEP_ID=MMETSP0803_2-20130417/36953_1 /TAXON_ID=195967 /ORGANISM="Crustomastix stigmata, Strain CCMP3273" /LENGTH=654 /DNA_ID=CAMNT_0026050057 /DNA_START=946 /DNA_END=2910 /DNA_ORIENTATION=-
MKWDENNFGREYDLDSFNAVAVEQFNMGAMENKSLNIFSAKNILSTFETATDEDLRNILRVVSHEYFHNWTGNRVTCRNWFELTLKEGLTVYRDQRFQEDIYGGTHVCERVKVLRLHYFPEDTGPSVHAVRPDWYASVDNLYTSTVYLKGAEIVRMYEVLLGKRGFRCGMDLYFERHDGQAVTCEDFCSAMADANVGVLDQKHFMQWYSYRGMPIVRVKHRYNEADNTFTLWCTQEPQNASESSQHLIIPIRIALLGAHGEHLSLMCDSPFFNQCHSGSKQSTCAVIRLQHASQVFTFYDILSPPVPSLLRGFSAPVRLVTPDLSLKDLLFLYEHDSDIYVRWDAGQQIMNYCCKVQLDRICSGKEPECDNILQQFTESIKAVLKSHNVSEAFKVELFCLPNESFLVETLSTIDPDAVHKVCKFVEETVIKVLQNDLEFSYTSLKCSAHPPLVMEVDVKWAAERNWRLCCLTSLCKSGIDMYLDEAFLLFRTSKCMETRMRILECLISPHIHTQYASLAVSEFYDAHKDEPALLEKWIYLQAHNYSLEDVAKLSAHPGFDAQNMNHVRALVNGFRFCQSKLHTNDGSGYVFLAHWISQIDEKNPFWAARFAGSFNNWRRYDCHRQKLMHEQLRILIEKPHISVDLHEVISSCLK